MNRHLGDFWPRLARRPLVGWAGMLATALVTIGCGRAPDAELVDPALRVPTQALVQADGYAADRIYTGRVQAAADSELGFEIGGLLAEALVDEGDVVAAGSVLARLDMARLSARRAELAAALEEAHARSVLAQATLARTEEALAYKGVSRQQYDEADKQAQASRAALAVAEARVAALDVDLDKAVLRAPFAGAVIQRFADPGEVLAPGQALYRVHSLAAPEVRMGVPGDEADSLRTGGQYSLEIGKEAFGARVRAVVPRRDDVTRTVDVIFVLDKAPGRVRPGDLARLKLQSHFVEPGFWVPVGALAEGPRGLWTNYIAVPLPGPAPQESATHRVVPHIVEILHADTDRAFVRGTLTSGDLLITDGLQRIVPGQAVAPVPDQQHAFADTYRQD